MPVLSRAHLRLYLRFYIFWLLSAIVLVGAAQLLINSELKENHRVYTLGLMRGTELLIEARMAQAPAEQWPAIVKNLDKKFNYPLLLRSLDDNRAKFDAQQLQKLKDGHSVLTDEGETLYRLLSDGQTLVVIGPLSRAENPEYAQTLRNELLIKLTIWGIAALLLAGVAWWWFRPLQLDARNLRMTAKALGDGELAARSPEAQSQLFAPLIETLNRMAGRIQQLMASHKEMSSMISHELRTPLARIRFSLGIVQELDDLDEMQAYFTRIEDDLTELDALVEAVLVHGRFEREEVHLRPLRADLQAWLRQQLGELDMLAGDIQLRLQTSQQCSAVDFDATLLVYALRNLVRNALKYADKQIVVSAQLRDGWVYLYVDDDGPGVPLAERDAILQPFTRFNRDRARSNTGFGLGLSIAAQIMQQHQGHLSIGDSPLGGARFCLSWPMHFRV